MRYEIHVSDVRSFKTCRRKWNWSSPLRRNLEPVIPYMPFFTGRAIHFALDQYYTNGTPLTKSAGEFIQEERKGMIERTGAMWEKEEEKVQEQVDLIVGMLEHYDTWVKKQHDQRWSDDQFQFIVMETEFSVPLRTPSGRASPRVYLAGRFDGVVARHDDGSIWLWETKTTRSIDEMTKSLANDEQCGAYMYAAQELLGVPITGVVYNLMRKKVPTFPRVLKDGTLSKAKNQDTTAEAYIRAIQTVHPDISNGKILANYGEILQYFINEGTPFFARVPVYRTPQEIESLQNDLWTVALEMVRPSTPLYPAPAWFNCGFCRFRSPCLAMNSQKDVEFILEGEFQARQKPTEVLLEEQNNG